MRAAYDSIYYDIRNAIRSGEYHYMDFLPSEGKLTEKYGCAHNTVRKALSLLASQGYIQAIHGKGVRVIYQSTPILTEGVKSFEPDGFESSEHEDSLEGCTVRAVSRNKVSVDETIAEQTGFNLSVELVEIERVRMLEGRPIEWEQCYLRGDAIGIPEDFDATRPFTEVFGANEVRLVTAKMQITAEPVSDRDTELLEIDKTGAVIVIRQAFFDRDGLLCEVSTTRRVPQEFCLLRTTIRSKLD
jgi:GntR family trehalose operon transcriptional repressor